ncbi:MAG: OmpH family outer membrane protein [Pseudomonadota bacterium]
MKKHLKAIIGAAALTFGAFAGQAALTAAVAQSQPVILIINQAQVIAQSKAGQSMAPQLQKLQEAANKELNTEAEKIVKEGEDLKKQKELMAEDVWLEKAKQVAVKQNNLPVLREVRVRELSIAEQKALGEISDVMKPILEKIVKDRGATLLLDRSAVMFASVDNDITQEVISELDKKLKSVKVEKVDLAELQKQAAAAANKKKK